jgi:hypothetical protein
VALVFALNRQVSPAPPVNTSAPVVSGDTTVDGLLQTTNGEWQGNSLDFTYQWLRDGASISGAINQQLYEITEDDIDAMIACDVTATNPSGNATARSNSIGPITSGVPVNTVAPIISGTPLEGETLTCGTGTWTGSAPIVYTYQWERDGVAIGGETAATYDLVEADATNDITCVVTATNAGGSDDAESNIIVPAALPDAPVNTVEPAVTGDAEVGETLTCTSGTWTGTEPIVYSYQWFSDPAVDGEGDAIVGATATTYVLTEAEDGLYVFCNVTATNAADAVVAKSNVTAEVTTVTVIVAPAVVQSATNFDNTGAKTITVNLATPATAGNLLISMLCIDKSDATSVTTPNLWTALWTTDGTPLTTFQRSSGGSNTIGCTSQLFAKIADGGETGVTFVWSGPSNRTQSVVIVEVGVEGAVYPLLTDALDQIGQTSSTTSLVSTLTATAPGASAVAESLALGFYTLDGSQSFNNAGTARAWQTPPSTADWSTVAEVATTIAAPGLSVGRKTLDATGTIAAKFIYTPTGNDVADEAHAYVVIVKGLSADAPPAAGLTNAAGAALTNADGATLTQES